MEPQKQEIITKLQKRDESGLRQLFDLYYTPLCVFSLKYLDSFEKAEDIVQEVFINFWENRRFVGISGSIRSYLFAAVKNNSLNYLRKNSRIRFEEIEDHVIPMIEEGRDLEDLERKKTQLYKELDQLSQQSRRVFEAIVFENQKYKEVAEELDVSVNTVKTYFSRALKQLRGSLSVIVWLLLQ